MIAELSNSIVVKRHRPLWRLCMVLVAALAVLCHANTAQAGITIIQSIGGIETGDRVSGEVHVTAKAIGDTSTIHYKLSGPVDIKVVRFGEKSSFMVDDEGKPAAWDTTTVPDGLYKLVVYSVRNGEVDRLRYVQFRVDNLTERPAADTVQKPNERGGPDQPATEEPATEEPATEEPATEEPATEEPATEEPATEEPATEEPVTGEPATEEPATEEPVAEEPVTEESVTEEPATEEPAAEEPASEEPVAEEPVTEESVAEESVTEEPATEEPAIESPAPTVDEEPTVSDPTPTPTTEPEADAVDLPEPITEPAPAPTPAFAVNFTHARENTYQQGSGRSIALSIAAEPGAGQDLQVLAWSVAEQRMVTEFAFVLTEGTWEIPASRLDLLPAGTNNLQLRVRQGNTTVSRVTRDFDVAAAVVPFEIGFDNAPSGYELGSGRSINLGAAGDLEDGADVLAIAWSITESRLVDAFAFAMNGSPWTIPAGRLDLLPEGEVELQLITRDSRRVKVTHKLTVSAPAPAVPEIRVASSTSFVVGQSQPMQVSLSEPIPADCDLVALAWSSAEQRMVTEFEHQLSNTAPVIGSDKLNTLPVGTNDLRLQVRQDGQVLEQVTAALVVEPAPVVIEEPVAEEPVAEEPAPAEPAVRFTDTPSQYTPGSGGAIGFAVENLPDGGDVLIIAWSDARGALVDGFGHSLKSGPWQITADKLNSLPAGTVELQLIVRGGDVRPKATHRVQIVSTQPGDGGDTTNPSPDSETDPTTDPGEEPNGDNLNGDNPGGDNTGDGGTDPADPNDGNDDPQTPSAEEPDLGDLTGAPVGFTVVNKASDTRVIYVSSSEGDDANDGRSEDKPVKSLARGQSLIRDGKPDWLLLKAGDTWEGQSFEAFDKGGSHSSDPMLIGAYGDGPRPVIIPASGEYGFRTTKHHIKGLVIQGLHIYAATRDPGSPKYVDRKAEADGINIRINSAEGKFVRGLVIEDCKISHFDANIKIVDDWARKQGEGVPGRIECKIRRNIIRYASGADSHSIGIYIEGTRDSVIEQNVIDHNGWAQTDDVSHRNKRSHNIYAQTFNGPLVVRYNILSRGAAHGLQLRAGGDIEHNLFVRNALAFWTAVNDSKANYNVVLESDDMNSDVPSERRGVGINGWSMDRFEVIGNVVARRVGMLQRPGLEVSANKELIVKDNKVYDWQDNRVGVSIDMAGPKTVSGNLSQEDFGGKEPPFVDPSRSVDSYAKTIGLDESLEAFLDAASARPRGVWIEELSTDAVNRYIRNGFELLPHD